MELTNGLSKCRLCLCDSGNFVHIFNVNVEKNYIVADLILGLLQFEVTREDGYPPFICNTCFNKLMEFQIFKEQCIACKETYDHTHLKPETIYGEPEILENRHVPACEEISSQIVVKEESLEEESDVHLEKRHVPAGEEISSEIVVKEEYLKEESDVHLENQHEPVSEELSSEIVVKEECLEDECDARSEICISPVKLEFDDEYVYPDAQVSAVTSQMSPVTESVSGTSSWKETSSNSNFYGNKSPVNLFAQIPAFTIQTSHVGESGSRTSSSMATCSESNLYGNKSPTNLFAEENFDQGRVILILGRGSETLNPLEGRLGGDLFGNGLREESSDEGLDATVGTREDNPSSYEMSTPSLRIMLKRKMDMQSNIRVQQRNKERKAEEELEEGGSKGRRSHLCHCCGKEYSTKTNLNTHMKIHGTEKPFICTACGKRFLHKHHVLRHLNTHRKKRNSACRECGKRNSACQECEKRLLNPLSVLR